MSWRIMRSFLYFFPSVDSCHGNQPRSGELPISPRSQGLCLQTAAPLATTVTPKFPEKPMARCSMAVVNLDAIIGTDGKVTSVKDSSGFEEFRESAIAAAKQWTYKPYLVNGVPTVVETTIGVVYVGDGTSGPSTFWMGRRASRAENCHRIADAAPSQASAWRLTQRRIRRGVRLHFGSPGSIRALGSSGSERYRALHAALYGARHAALRRRTGCDFVRGRTRPIYLTMRNTYLHRAGGLGREGQCPFDPDCLALGRSEWRRRRFTPNEQQDTGDDTTTPSLSAGNPIFGKGDKNSAASFSCVAGPK